jgi:putative superfamily III holin-X
MNPSPGTGSRATPPTSLAAPVNEPPLKDVLVELWQNLEKLFQQQLALASAEIDLKAQRLKSELTAVAIGAGLLLVGVLALVAAIILLLDLFMAAWLAALITGGVATGVGVALIMAKKPTTADVIPERTIASVAKDVQTFREATK